MSAKERLLVKFSHLVQQIFIKICPISMVIKLKRSQETPGGLVKTGFLGPAPRVSDSVILDLHF